MVKRDNKLPYLLALLMCVFTAVHTDPEGAKISDSPSLKMFKDIFF